MLPLRYQCCKMVPGVQRRSWRRERKQLPAAGSGPEARWRYQPFRDTHASCALLEKTSARTPMPYDKQLSRRKEAQLSCTICTFLPGDHEHLFASHLLPTAVKERSSLLLITERIFETMRKGIGPSQRDHLAP